MSNKEIYDIQFRVGNVWNSCYLEHFLVSDAELNDHLRTHPYHRLRKVK